MLLVLSFNMTDSQPLA